MRCAPRSLSPRSRLVQRAKRTVSACPAFSSSTVSARTIGRDSQPRAPFSSAEKRSGVFAARHSQHSPASPRRTRRSVSMPSASSAYMPSAQNAGWLI